MKKALTIVGIVFLLIGSGAIYHIFTPPSLACSYDEGSNNDSLKQKWTSFFASLNREGVACDCNNRWFEYKFRGNGTEEDVLKVIAELEGVFKQNGYKIADDFVKPHNLKGFSIEGYTGPVASDMNDPDPFMSGYARGFDNGKELVLLQVTESSGGEIYHLHARLYPSVEENRAMMKWLRKIQGQLLNRDGVSLGIALLYMKDAGSNSLDSLDFMRQWINDDLKLTWGKPLDKVVLSEKTKKTKGASDGLLVLNGEGYKMAKEIYHPFMYNYNEVKIDPAMPSHGTKYLGYESFQYILREWFSINHIVVLQEIKREDGEMSYELSEHQKRTNKLNKKTNKHSYDQRSITVGNYDAGYAINLVRVYERKSMKLVHTGAFLAQNSKAVSLGSSKRNEYSKYTDKIELSSDLNSNVRVELHRYMRQLINMSNYTEKGPDSYDEHFGLYR